MILKTVSIMCDKSTLVYFYNLLVIKLLVCSLTLVFIVIIILINYNYVLLLLYTLYLSNNLLCLL